jgi:hypothetical protein
LIAAIRLTSIPMLTLQDEFLSAMNDVYPVPRANTARAAFALVRLLFRDSGLHKLATKPAPSYS